MSTEEQELRSHCKLFFHLEIDEDGYPPASTESLWAIQQGEHLVVDNIPFFARGVSCGDIVSFDLEDGDRYFREVVQDSGHSTVRMIIYDREKRMSAVCARLEELGCQWEQSPYPSLIAVDVPPTANIDALRSFLDAGIKDESFEYEEAKIFW